MPRKILAGHELYVAQFYYYSGHYKSALGRFQAVIARYPDVGVHQQAMQYIALCEERIQMAQADENARTAAQAAEATEKATERAREAVEDGPPPVVEEENAPPIE
jgi:outer membrane protein assembly factor BamD